MSCPALAPSAALQAIKDVGQSLVALPVDKVEIDPRVGKRTAKAQDQREFLWGEVVAVFLERRRQIVSRLVSKCWVGHRLFGEPLQHLDSNRTIVGKCHRTTSSPGGVIV
jgi:hypothetical protein